MSVQNKTRALVEAALIAAITSIFCIIGNFVPFLGILLFFLPVPFMILGKRHGVYTELLSIITAGIVIGTLLGPISTLTLFIQFGIMAIVMGYMMKKEYTAGKTWLGGALASLVSMVITVVLISAISEINLIDSFMEAMKESIDISISMYRGMGVDANKLSEMEKMYESTLQYAGMILPSSVIMAAAFSAYFNYILTAYILNRIGHKTLTFPEFKYFQLPKSIIMGTVLILVLTYVTGYLKIIHYESVVINISYLFNMVFLIQGLAIVNFFNAKYGIRKLLRIFIYVLVFFNPLGRNIVVFLGITDAFADFRKLKKLG